MTARKPGRQQPPTPPLIPSPNGPLSVLVERLEFVLNFRVVDVYGVERRFTGSRKVL